MPKLRRGANHSPVVSLEGEELMLFRLNTPKLKVHMPPNFKYYAKKDDKYRKLIRVYLLVHSILVQNEKNDANMIPSGNGILKT